MSASNHIPLYLCNVDGIVEEILPPCKAVITFIFNDREERALLVGNKMLIDARKIDSSKLYEYINEGSKIKFSCHDLNEIEIERCHWVVIKACLHPKESHEKISSLRLTFGIYNMRGYITKLTRRHGIITYSNANGR